MHGLTFLGEQKGRSTLIYGSRFRCVKQDSMLIKLLLEYFAIFDGRHLHYRSVINISVASNLGGIIYDVCLRW